MTTELSVILQCRSNYVKPSFTAESLWCHKTPPYQDSGKWTAQKNILTFIQTMATVLFGLDKIH